MPYENAGQRPKCEHREHVAAQQDQVEAALPALPDDDRGVVICRIAVNPSATFPPTLPALPLTVKAHRSQSDLSWKRSFGTIKSLISLAPRLLVVKIIAREKSTRRLSQGQARLFQDL
jgi:hypothetical protein